MGQYDICTDYMTIIAGTSNKIATPYLEASKSIESDNTKSMAYLKNFITSIESIAAKSANKEKAIAESKGNIKNLPSYENIKYALDFTSKNLGKIKVLADISTLLDCLEKNQSLYTEGYTKQIRLIMLEYESIAYMVITGLVEVMANDMDVVQNGYKIQIKKKFASTHGTINSTISKLADEVKKPSHKDYLEALIKGIEVQNVDTKIEVKKEEDKSVNESTVFTESAVTDTISLIGAIFNNAGRIVKAGITGLKAIKKSLFGIIPLIRSVMYMKYKRKADKIAALDLQVEYLKNNIEQLQNKKGDMSPEKKAEIIKKQQAQVEAYKKRAAKLRAQLMEEEKEAATEIAKEDPKMKETDNDYVLEGVSVKDIFEDIEESFGKSKKAPTPIPSQDLPKELKDALESAIKEKMKSGNVKEIKINDIEKYFGESVDESRKKLKELVKNKTPISFEDLEGLDTELKNNDKKNGKKPIEPMVIYVMD
jgi:hypothetical protein